MKRLLKPSEINCRVQQISEKGLSILLYVTSRAGQNILDETYGVLGWKREHQIIDGNLYCTISVWNETTKQWVSKQDVGTESYTEKEKGQASDSFKRACVNWGIGRELYSAPYIWINASSTKITANKNGKYTCNDKFSVKNILYNDAGEIEAIEIINSRLETVYKKWQDTKVDTIKIKLINDELKRTGVQLKHILEMCKIEKLADMTTEDFTKIYKKLKLTHDRV